MKSLHKVKAPAVACTRTHTCTVKVRFVCASCTLNQKKREGLLQIDEIKSYSKIYIVALEYLFMKHFVQPKKKGQLTKINHEGTETNYLSERNVPPEQCNFFMIRGLKVLHEVTFDILYLIKRVTLALIMENPYVNHCFLFRAHL